MFEPEVTLLEEVVVPKEESDDEKLSPEATDGLHAQTRLFDELKGDIDNIKHYLELAKE